ncbi:Uncharacterized protein LOK49_Contig67G00003 [Camellia lanceoleosa]|nr:Uncharacterized protein LOK49_Contig67G00003 [Camellia lanceoleosa]
MSKKLGKNFGQRKLKGKYVSLKANYKEFVALKNNTGLDWDSITQIVIAPDDIWESYVQAHLNAKQLQNKGLEHYELMSQIFAKSFAIGAFARSSRQGAPTFDDEREMNERFHDEFFDVEESSEKDEDEGEGKGKGEGEGGVENVNENEDGVPKPQQENHINMPCEQLLHMGQWRDELALSIWEAYNNR